MLIQTLMEVFQIFVLKETEFVYQNESKELSGFDMFALKSFCCTERNAEIAI